VRARVAWARPEAQIRGGAAAGRVCPRGDWTFSDGLAGDVQHLAAASRVKAVVEAARLYSLISRSWPTSADLLGEPGAALALTGGEDYALLCAAQGPPPAGAKVVGRIERASGSELELGPDNASSWVRGSIIWRLRQAPWCSRLLVGWGAAERAARQRPPPASIPAWCACRSRRRLLRTERLLW